MSSSRAIRGSASARRCPASWAARSRVTYSASCGSSSFDTNSAPRLGVDDALGGQRAGGDVQRRVVQLVDGGPQDELEVGGQIAGVGDALRGVARLRSGLLGGPARQVEEGLHQHGGLGGPPAVDGLLADPGAGGDTLDRRAPVAHLSDEGEGGVVDRAAGAVAAAAGVGCLGGCHTSNLRRTSRYVSSCSGIKGGAASGLRPRRGGPVNHPIGSLRIRRARRTMGSRTDRALPTVPRPRPPFARSQS